jgi:HD-like signal output (HDOD) protein
MTVSTAPNYGRGEYDLPSDTIDLEENQAQLMAWLDGFLKQPNVDIPRPPAVALEVLALSKKASARIEDIAQLLEREPLLAGRVMKLSNSALYGAAMPCVTLKQSLIRMGLSIVRDVVMEAAMQMTIIHSEGVNATLESVRRHSSAVAWVSRFVARNTPLEAENAFLLGLLHDVGISVGLVGLTEYLRVRKLPPKLTPSRWLAVESMHERISEAVLKAWGLPPVVTLVAQHHHTLMLGGKPHPQVAVLIIAEHIAQDAGWGVRPIVEQSEDDIAMVCAREESMMDNTDTALASLALTRKHFDMVKADTKPVLQTLAGQFNKK